MCALLTQHFVLLFSSFKIVNELRRDTGMLLASRLLLRRAAPRHRLLQRSGAASLPCLVHTSSIGWRCGKSVSVLCIPKRRPRELPSEASLLCFSSALPRSPPGRGQPQPEHRARSGRCMRPGVQLRCYVLRYTLGAPQTPIAYYGPLRWAVRPAGRCCSGAWGRSWSPACLQR
jgi:hypothetical protein